MDDILQRHQRFPREMTSKKQGQKFHTDDWWNLLQPIRSTTQVWVVTCHQYGISALVSQTSFHRKTVGVVAKCHLFSQATPKGVISQGYYFFRSILYWSHYLVPFPIHKMQWWIQGRGPGARPGPPYFSTKMRPEGLKKMFFSTTPPPPPPLIWRSGSATEMFL